MQALEEEQRHLDETRAAYDLAFAALVGRRRSQGIDDFANEALERMRRERIRVYTEASGPLYFGRVDQTDGETLYVGRHAVWSADNDLLSVNWRAPAAEPFYAATAHAPRGVRRRRRLDIEERTVVGFVDETLTPDDDDHLTDAIVEDITRRRVGEMRQIISTITPDQYELISREAAGALVIQGGPGTGKTAVGLHRAAWLLYADPELTRQGVLVVGPNETFIRYIEQVLPALGEGGVEQRPIGSLISQPHGEVDETRELAALKGSGRMAVVLERLLWGRLSLEGGEVPFGRRKVVTVTPEDLRELVAAVRERTFSYEAGRERFRERLAGLIAGRLLDRDSLAGQEEAISAVRKTKGVPAHDDARLAARDAGSLGRAPVQEPREARGGRGRTALRRRADPVVEVERGDEATGHDAHRRRAARRGALADRPELPALRARGRRRGAEPDADGAAHDRAARPRAFADDPRRPVAAHRRRRRVVVGRGARRGGRQRPRGQRAEDQLPRPQRLPGVGRCAVARGRARAAGRARGAVRRLRGRHGRPRRVHRAGRGAVRRRGGQRRRGGAAGAPRGGPCRAGPAGRRASRAGTWRRAAPRGTAGRRASRTRRPAAGRRASQVRPASWMRPAGRRSGRAST